MPIKQQVYAPLPHKHYQEDIIGEMPICEMQFPGTASIANATDTACAGGWVAVQDNANMFYSAATGGTGAGYDRMRIPKNGRYDIEWQYYIDGIGSTTCSASVLKDSASVTTGTLISGQGAGNGWAAPLARGTKYLTEGTYLYFWLWHNAGGSRTMYGSWFGGGRSRATVRWIGNY